MGNISSKTVSIYIDQTAAVTALENLQFKADGFSKKIENARKEQEKLKKQIEDTSAAGGSITKLQERYDQLSTKVNGYNKTLRETAEAQKKIQDSIDKGLRPSFTQQERLVNALRNQLRQMSEDAPGYAEKFKKFRESSAELDRMKTAINGVDKAQSNWFQQAKTVAFGVLIGNTVQAAVAAIGSYLSGIVSGNAKLSDSLADVQKTTGLTAAQVASLNSQLGKIDTRTSTANLREIAIGLGQIGEAATAANVAAIDKIVVALGDEFGGGAKEITTTLSVLRNNLQDIKTGDYGTDVANIGNALNVLGANGLATAPVVVDIANRMAGVAGTFKLSSGEILGTAATFQELGIEVERGSTAFTKILQKIAVEPEKFAKVAGVPIKEFTNLVNTNMLQAFSKVAEGAGKAGSSNVAFARILKELDADGTGAGEVLSKLSKNQELLTSKVSLASEALTNQNSLTQEFNLKNENLAANLEKLGKIINSLFANSVLSNILASITGSLVDMASSTKTATERFDEQQTSVNNLEKNINPLLDRYDTLKSKTNLNATEQGELKKIIASVTSILPSAASEFDKYGNVIAINTGRVREFIDAEKARLKVTNASAIQENNSKLSEIEQRLAITKKQIDQIANTGSFLVTVKESGDGKTGGTTFQRKATEAEIKQKQDLYRELLSQQLGYSAEVKRLNGDQLQEQIDAAKKSTEEQLKNQQKADAASLSQTIEGNAKKDQELEKALSRLKALSEEFSKLSQSDYAYAFQQIFQQKAEDEKLFREKFAGEALTKALDQLQKTTEQKIIDLNEKLGSKAKDNPVVVDVVPEIQEEDIALLKASMGRFLKSLSEDERNAAAKRALALLNGNRKEKLNATIGNLDAAEQKELSNTELLESEKEVIREKYRHQRSQAEQESLNEELDNISNALSYFQEAVNIADKFNQAKTSKENSALYKQLKSNDVEKQAYKKLLDTKLITQQQYNQQIDRLDKDADAKKEALQKKQFERQKKLELINAGINGAQAVLATIKQFGAPIPPNFAGIAAFAFTLATVGAEIATIASKKYALGGKLEGPSHEANGIKRNVNGRHVEFEGDEGVIKKSAMRSNRMYTVTGTPSQITSSLNGMYGGVTWDTSAIVTPSYKRRPYQAVDYSRINSSYSNLKFAEGGITPGTNGNGGNGQPVIINNSDEETKALMRAVLKRLENPVAPYVNFKLTKLEDAQSQKARIQNNAGFH
ncbi:phage tail tape measure protein [Limnovirga soli]|uniref:Phage tail tape measure protein n=1 Tax=Limnovirga soli TaxID=2656915 RepID=A0A8J8JW54_9BACT|nr:phage tail tape measure protein [Limnovirga soli]NNV57379.1 phage tail tape measure protein [Limnovirga soli]